jgi:ubiquinone/menaquinone biosynthesis C-methylase UbiE
MFILAAIVDLISPSSAICCIVNVAVQILDNELQMVSSRASIAVPEIVPQEFWELEFSQKHVIPSSTRTEPAKALLLFSEILNLGSNMKVLDAGSGNGRNTVYLAKRGCEVTAVDFSEFALNETKRRVNEAGVSQKVSIVRHSLVDPLPFSRDYFDFGVDSYVFCHFLRDETALRFWREMARVTKRGGYMLSIVFSTQDEYDARLRRDASGEPIVCDPTNGIWKRLYSEEEIKTFFSSQFELTYFSKFEFFDIVQGENYRRVLFVSVLRNVIG